MVVKGTDTEKGVFHCIHLIVVTRHYQKMNATVIGSKYANFFFPSPNFCCCQMMSKTIIYHYNIKIFTRNAYLFQKSHNVNNLCTAPKQLDRPGAPPTSVACVLGLLPIRPVYLSMSVVPPIYYTFGLSILPSVLSSPTRWQYSSTVTPSKQRQF